MAKIIVKDREGFEAAMRRFKKAVDNSGLLKELRSREAYEKPTTERKRKKASAIARYKKQQNSGKLTKLY